MGSCSYCLPCAMLEDASVVAGHLKRLQSAAGSPETLERGSDVIRQGIAAGTEQIVDRQHLR